MFEFDGIKYEGRVTSKRGDNYDVPTGKEDVAIHKAGLLEDIEDELEVEFLTIQKLRKVNHIYVNSDGNIRRLSYYNIRIDDESVFINGDLDKEDYVEEDYIFEIKDKEYGKSWAFTKEELEETRKYE